MIFQTVFSDLSFSIESLFGLILSLYVLEMQRTNFSKKISAKLINRQNSFIDEKYISL